MQTLVRDAASFAGFRVLFLTNIYPTEGFALPYRRELDTSIPVFSQRQVGFMPTIQPKALAEINCTVGFSNVARLCLHLSIQKQVTVDRNLLINWNY